MSIMHCTSQLQYQSAYWILLNHLKSLVTLSTKITININQGEIMEKV